MRAKPRNQSILKPHKHAADEVRRHPLWRNPLLLSSVLAVATFILYLPVLGQPFAAYDDDLYVQQNQHIRNRVKLSSIRWAVTSTENANWHPLTWLSHAADVELYGLDPAGHHLTNVLLHLANTVLLFLLLAWGTGARGRSFLVAALFAIHPLNVESVAWIAERKNVLSTLFFLLAIGAYGSYARKPSSARGFAVVTLFILGLASKPMVITLPFVLLLMDFWPLRRIRGQAQPPRTNEIPQLPFSRLLIEKSVLLLPVAGSAAITLIAQGRAVKPLAAFSFFVRLENAAYAYLLYLGKTFWPVNLAPFYPHPGNSIRIWQASLGMAVIIAISFWGWRQRREQPYVLTGWLWFLGTLVPVIGLVQVGDQAMADRYAYVPLIGIFVMLVWGAADVANRFQLSRGVRFIAAAIILACLGGLALRQISYWQSPYTFWAHTLEVTKDNPVAENNLAGVLMVMGREDEALAHFENVTRTHPTFSVSHLDVANILRSHNQISGAMAEYAAAIQAASLDPGEMTNSQVLVLASIKLGNLYVEQRDYDKARQLYGRALQADAAVANAEVSNLTRQAEAHPSAVRYLCLGMIQQLAGKKPDAGADFQRALELDPGLEEAGRSLGEIQSATRQ